jgi:GNAT superfamily N-acetyltransferase
MQKPIYQELSPQQIHSAQQMSHELWSGGSTLEERVARLESYSRDYPGMLRSVGLISASGEVLTSSKLYSCQIMMDGAPLSLVGIGAVFTDPDQRRKGLAAQMIELCLAEAQQSGLRGALLWSDIGSEYYERFGFVRLPLVRHRYDITNAAAKNQSRPAQNEDRNKMIDLYRRKLERLTMASIRKGTAWDFYRRLNGAKDYIVETPNGQFCGFFSASVYRDYLWVDEAFAEMDCAAKVWAQISRLAKQSGVKMIQSWNQPFDLLPMPELMQQVQKPIPMIRLFDDSVPVQLSPSNCFFGSLDHF